MNPKEEKDATDNRSTYTIIGTFIIGFIIGRFTAGILHF